MKVTQHIINRLIELGGELSLDDEIVTNKYNDLRREDSINRLYWRDWDEVTRDLNTENLAALIKALTMCERCFGWQGSSVSSVIWTFRELRRRDTVQSEEIAKWVLERTNNEYVPFGTIR